MDWAKINRIFGKIMNKITIPLDIFQIMMINHVRYGLTRQSYMAGIVIKDVKKYWDVLSNNTKNTIRQDVADKINDYLTRLEDRENQNPFWYTDFHSWQDLHNWINANA